MKERRIMRRSLLIVIAVLGFGSAGLFAQSSEVPTIDIYGAYSHSSNLGIGQSGWLAPANYDVVPNMGLEADVSGGGTNSLGIIAVILPGIPNGIRSRMHSVNLSPRYTFHPSSTHDAEAFGHLLFGFSHSNVSATGQATRLRHIPGCWAAATSLRPISAGALKLIFCARIISVTPTITPALLLAWCSASGQLSKHLESVSTI
jgi:hypothetical protein